MQIGWYQCSGPVIYMYKICLPTAIDCSRGNSRSSSGNSCQPDVFVFPVCPLFSRVSRPLPVVELMGPQYVGRHSVFCIKKADVTFWEPCQGRAPANNFHTRGF